MSAALPLLSPLVTRILELSGFPPELKTRDIHAVFAAWEDDRGGFKIKWRDDTTALIVFQDPATGESMLEELFRKASRLCSSAHASPPSRPAAKRAYLHTLMSPPPSLMTSAGVVAKVRPYDGDDASAVISSIQNRPRARSNAGSQAAATAYENGATSPNKSRTAHLAGLGHRRTGSGSNPSSLPPKPIAAALYDAANGGPSAASHIVNASEREGHSIVQDDIAPNPLAAAIAAAHVGHVGESARSGKGLTLGEANAAAAAEESAIDDSGETTPEAPGGGARIGDAGKRMIAGALGKRHKPSSQNGTPSPTSGSNQNIDPIVKKVQGLAI